MPILSKADITAINRIRLGLKKLATLDQTDYPGLEFEGGKFDEACEAAEQALFRVLVIASVYLGVEISESELHLEE